jgi:hypothetical protein
MNSVFLMEPTNSLSSMINDGGFLMALHGVNKGDFSYFVVVTICKEA